MGGGQEDEGGKSQMVGGPDSRFLESHKVAKWDCRFVGIPILHVWKRTGRCGTRLSQGHLEGQVKLNFSICACVRACVSLLSGKSDKPDLVL